MVEKTKQVRTLPVYISCLTLMLAFQPEAVTSKPYLSYVTSDEQTGMTRRGMYPWFFTTDQRAQRATSTYQGFYTNDQSGQTGPYPGYPTESPSYPWFYTNDQQTQPETQPRYPWLHSIESTSYPWFYTTDQRTKPTRTPSKTTYYPWWFFFSRAPVATTEDAETTTEENLTTVPEKPNRCQVCRDLQCFTGPQVVTCSAQQPLCSSRITDTSGSMGGRAVVKGCASRSQCDAWTPGHNELRYCLQVDRQVSGRDVDCLFCCHGDLCNQGPTYIPKRETWVGTNQQTLLTN